MRTEKLLGIIALLAGLIVSPATQQLHAQWSGNNLANTPVCVAAGDQQEPQIVSDGAGGAIIAWVDIRDSHVYAQRLDAKGNSLWISGGVKVSLTKSDGLYVRMVSDGQGGAILVWSQVVSAFFGDCPLVCQRVNAQGLRVWSGETVIPFSNYANAFGDLSVAIVSDGLNGAIIISKSQVRNAAPWIQAMRVNGAGNKLWQKDVSPSLYNMGRYHPVAVSDGNGGAIFAYEESNDTRYRSDIYAQRVNSAGDTIWTSRVPVCLATGIQTELSIAPDGGGGAVIAWSDLRRDIGDIYAQRVSGAGNSLWATNGVLVHLAQMIDMTIGSSKPKVASDNDGGAFFTWEDLAQGRHNVPIICAQRVNNTGAVVWATNGVVIGLYLGHNPQIISDGVGGAIVTWFKSIYNALDKQEILAQRLDASGSKLWGDWGLSVSRAGSTGHAKEFPVLVGDGNNGAIITWQDMRNGNLDVYAQRVNQYGVLGGDFRVTNGDFENGLASWQTGGCATANIVPGCNSASAAKVTIGNTNCNAQFYQHGFVIERGKRYRVKFQAWSSRGEDMQLTVLPHNASTPNIGLDKRVDLGVAPCTNYQFDFLATGSTTDARLRFYFNFMSAAGYWYAFDNVSIEKLLPKEGEREELALPTTIVLEQNFPNPFNPTTNISFSIPNDGNVSLKVFDLLGREVATLVNETRVAGSYTETFDASRLSSGTYFYRLESGSFSKSMKLMLIK